MSRSEQMSRIRGQDTTPEVRLRKELWRAGLRYRLACRVEGCRPDLVMKRRRVVVFVDGCFWHGCPNHYVPPRSKRVFWRKKLAANVNRDIRNTRDLEAAGWRVFRVWEHDVMRDPEGTGARLIRQILSSQSMIDSAPRVLRVRFLDRRGDLEERHLVDLRDKDWQAIVNRRRTTKKI